MLLDVVARMKPDILSKSLARERERERGGGEAEGEHDIQFTNQFFGKYLRAVGSINSINFREG